MRLFHRFGCPRRRHRNRFSNESRYRCLLRVGHGIDRSFHGFCRTVSFALSAEIIRITLGVSDSLPENLCQLRALHIRLLSLNRFQHLRANEKTFFSDRGKFKTHQTKRAPRNLFLSARLDCKSTGDDQMTQSRSESAPSEPDTSPHHLRTYR